MSLVQTIPHQTGSTFLITKVNQYLMSEILKDTNLWRSLESICYVLILMFIFFQLFKTYLFRVASCCVATVIDSLNDPTFPRIPNEKLDSILERKEEKI